MFFWETLTFPCCPWGLDALRARLIEQEGQECVARCMASETRTYREHFLGSIVDEVRYEHWGPWGHCHVIVILYILCIYYVYVYKYIYKILNKLHMFNIMTIMTPMVNTIYIRY